MSRGTNLVLMPYINEAVWALHDGVAELEAIDTGLLRIDTVKS
jgi:3-hydroxyacyl-CoA dehydrogenase